jgi:hypothetical protein
MVVAPPPGSAACALLVEEYDLLEFDEVAPEELTEYVGGEETSALVPAAFVVVVSVRVYVTGVVVVLT